MLRTQRIIQRILSNNHFIPAFRSASCWKCNTDFDHIQIICPKCNSLSELVGTPNYFDLLKVERNFNVDLQKLQENFRKYQSIVHPDKFSSQSQQEQELSADWSSLLNKAYTTLQQPIKRGEYMLAVEHIEIPERNETMNAEFLMEMMEKNEEVAELKTRQEVDAYMGGLQKEFDEINEELGREIEKKEWEKALNVLIRMRYINNLIVKLKEKMYGVA